MKLFLLKVESSIDEKYDAKMVRAKTESHAREIVKRVLISENPNWANPTKVTCMLVEIEKSS